MVERDANRSDVRGSEVSKESGIRSISNEDEKLKIIKYRHW